MEIIPAIDIMGGKVVRLKQGKFHEQTIYSESPLEVAQRYQAASYRRLHLVDLDGARKKTVVNWKVLRDITEGTGLKVDFGGGIQTGREAAEAFQRGAAQINVGSLAVENPELLTNWLQIFGAEKVILSADVRDGFIAAHGWRTVSNIRLLNFLEKYAARGIRWVALTDISRDGMLTGPAVELYRAVKNTFPELKIIASGGVSRAEDLFRLKNAGLDGVIIGKALLSGKIKNEEVRPFLD